MNFFKTFNISINTESPKDVDGYENLQKRINEKYEFLEKASNSFNELNKYLKDIFKKLVTLNSNFTTASFSIEEQNIQETFKLIFQKIINNVQQDNQLVETINKIVKGHLKTFIKEKKLYNEFKILNKELQEEKEKLHNNKELYHKLGKEAENKIKKFVENNSKKLSNLSEELKKELENITMSPIKALNIYKNNVDKVNILKKEFNYKQNILFECLPELGNEDGVFFFRLVKTYLQNLEDGERYLNLNKKQLNDSKTIESNSKLKEIIEKNESNKKEEKSIQLIQYDKGLNIIKCKNREDFDIYAKSIEMINHYINKEIFPNYNYNNELKKFEEFQLIKEMFEDKDLDENKVQKFLDSLKDESLHKTIYIVISQLRVGGKFEKSKALIELIGKAFEILLDYAEKNKLYENAKNYIILSQTYFYYNENQKKIYVSELIKKNKWLTNPQFWRGFIEYMIKNEFDKFEATFPESNIKVEKNINITDKVKEKLSEIIFSQLLSYVNNMVDFGIDKRIILKIADEFKEKYNYMTPDNLDTLYQTIFKNKEEIEKLRKEYKPSLELEIILNKNEDIKNESDEKITENNNRNVEEVKNKIKKEKSKEINNDKRQIKETLKDMNESKEKKEDNKSK